MSLRDDLSPLVKGDVADDEATLAKFSKDTSIFHIRPSVVVHPKDADDISTVIQYTAREHEKGRVVSVTARAAGTCMSGGPLSDSIVLATTTHLNRMREIGADYARAEVGMMYRDFEKATLEKNGMLLPPYPASRELCALGGMIANNAGGELTLQYGKMDRYVRSLDVVLSDGSRVTLTTLSRAELEEKKKLPTLEGTIYRDIEALIMANREEIRKARPKVSKNSAGYALWDIIDDETGTFDLTKLFVGAQGTLGIITEATLGLEKLKPHRAMLVIFMSDLAQLPEVVKRVLSFTPESFESYDDHTFKLAAKFGYEFMRNIGVWKAIKLAFSFLPELRMTLTGGIPKLVLLAEFAEESEAEAEQKAHKAQDALSDLKFETQIATGTMEAKYWKIRRESFALLRKHVHGLKAAPFIDDIVVHPEDYPSFLPKLNELLAKYNIMYTIAGHIGSGNFHIIPLVDLNRPDHRETIMKLTPEVYALVAEYKGSITGEHGDGIMRTPFLHMMFSPHMLKLFADTKHICDPLNILNPGKKVGATLDDIQQYMMHPKKAA